jgi:hypothetical protein
MSLLFGKGGCSRPVLTVFLCAFVAAAVPLGQGAYGQYGPFLEKGIGAGVGVSETDNTTTLGTRIGYVIDGPIEIGLEAYIEDLRLGVGPYVSVYPLAGSETEGLSFSISGSYSFDTYLSGPSAGPTPAQNGDVEETGNTASIGASVFDVLTLVEGDRAEKRSSKKRGEGAVKIVPTAGVTYTNVTREATSGGRTLSEDNNGETSFGISASILFDTGGSANLVVTPALSFSENNAFGLSASVVFPE